MNLQQRLKKMSAKYGIQKADQPIFQNEMRNVIAAAVADLVQISRRYGMDSTDVNTERILEATAHAFNIEKEMLFIKGQQRHIVVPRNFACYMLRKMGMKYDDIGAKFNKDHSTAMYAVRTTKELIEESDFYREEITRFYDYIKGGLFIDNGEIAHDCEI